MRILIGGLALLGWALVFSHEPALAQTGSSPTAPREPLGAPVIAVVDVQAVMRKAVAAAKVRTVLEQERKSFETQLEARRRELREAEAELRRQQALLAPDAAEQRRRDLEQRYATVRRGAESRQAQINGAFNAAMRRIRAEMNRVIAEMMKDRGVTITLPRGGVLIYDERLNVTEDVLSRLNQRLPDMEIRFEQPPKQ